MEKELKQVIQDFAETVLNTFSDGKPIGNNIERFVGSLGGIIQERNLDIWADGKLEMANVIDDPSIRFIITVEPMQNRQRKNFTIAHEIGHLFLHTNYVNSLENNQNLEFPDFYRDGDTEQEYQANEFAATLLMPKELYIKKVHENVLDNNTVNIREVANYFNVSIDAAINRGKWLGVLSW